jgi:hypothetical protein
MVFCTPLVSCKSSSDVFIDDPREFSGLVLLVLSGARLVISEKPAAEILDWRPLAPD